LPIFILTILPALILFDIQGDFSIKKFSRTEVKDYLEIIKKQEYKEELIRTKGKEKIIGIYMNGEFIDGPRLERMKKLERICN
jgi:threonyl-tRNA synthetase